MPSFRHVATGLVVVAVIAGCAAPSATVTVVAEGVAFTSDPIRVSAGQGIRVTFENRDERVPHGLNLQKRTSGVEPTSLWTSEIQIGPSIGLYDIPVLPPGPYQFVCRVHLGMLVTLDVG